MVDSAGADRLREARASQQAGRFHNAEIICQKILESDPDSAEALHRLGVLLYLQARPDEAAVLIERAITLKAGVPEFYVSLCLALLAASQYEKYDAAMHDAERRCRDILAAVPDDAEGLHRLGVLADLRGEHEAAIVLLERAIAKRGDDAEAHNDLGLAQLSARHAKAAGRSFAEALRLNPQYVGAANNLALALETQGKFSQAIAACRRVLELKPDFPLAWFNLGSMLQQHGDPKEAEQSFLRALELQPGYAEAHNNLGSIYEEQRRTDEAVASYRTALALKPLDIQPHLSLGRLLHNLGQIEEAETVYKNAQLNIRDAGLDIHLATMLPPIMPRSADIAGARARYERELGALLQRPIQINDLQAEGLSNFFLPYHGFNDKPLQQLLASVYARARPDLMWSSADSAPAWDGKRKLRLGFISSFFKNHSIGKLTSGLIASIARDKFEVTTLFAPPFKDDGMSRYIAAHSDTHHVLPTDLHAARVFIADLELDVLFYTDIGMDLFCYFLAFARLAPAQCVTWGHPVTTGIPNVDYFISHEDCETEGAQAHYSEKLLYLRAPANFTYFFRPLLPERLKTRADFGFTDDQHLYVCPQSLFKFHPDFDPVLNEILSRDPQGRLVLIDGATLSWNSVLMKRFAESMPDEVLRRIGFLPRQYGDDFLNLIALCDVMLDAFPFAGGTSSFEGFATGIPIVTMPTQFLRGRCTHACYRRMEIADCTASSTAEYAQIALRLGTDAVYRTQIRGKILARSHLLYDDVAAAREFERCFEEMSRGR
jgi:protein O-GlcNAc transferase